MLKSSKFDFLIKQYKNKIYGYSVYMIRNRMDAEDITQEVMIRLWQNIEKFNFYLAKGWIMRTTHNLCIDYIRRNKNIGQKEVNVDENYSEQLEDSSCEGNPYSAASKNITEARIKNAIESLPERLKSPFVLYELEGFKYKEISKILDVPLNSVKVNLLRARKLLQKELKEYANKEIS